MPFEAEYAVTATIRGLPDGTRLLRALSADGRSVAIKVLASEQATPEDADRLRNEFEVGSHITCAAVLHPRVFDLNELVRSMDRLLERVLGDDIELMARPSPKLDLVEADVGQIEQVVLNIAINARDAMPDGGALTIETSNVVLDEDYAGGHTGVTPGPFAMMTLSDTGTGISPAVFQHISEPFFTTKKAGEGTGLGLATSYGIIKQAGGHIRMYSEPDKGTTFEIYLPRSAKVASLPLRAPAPSPTSRGETVLLVEDHAMLRNSSVRGLEALGYRVLAAQSGPEAIRVATAPPETIDLLLTDVAMPKMSGPELAERLLKARPGLRVLYVSGYTENTVNRTGVRRQGTHFLAKPFTPDQLARTVRDVLDGAPIA